MFLNIVTLFWIQYVGNGWINVFFWSTRFFLHCLLHWYFCYRFSLGNNVTIDNMQGWKILRHVYQNIPILSSDICIEPYYKRLTITSFGWAGDPYIITSNIITWIFYLSPTKPHSQTLHWLILRRIYYICCKTWNTLIILIPSRNNCPKFNLKKKKTASPHFHIFSDKTGNLHHIWKHILISYQRN